MHSRACNANKSPIIKKPSRPTYYLRYLINHPVPPAWLTDTKLHAGMDFSEEILAACPARVVAQLYPCAPKPVKQVWQPCSVRAFSHSSQSCSSQATFPVPRS